MKNVQIISALLLVFVLNSCSTDKETTETAAVAESSNNNEYLLTKQQFTSSDMKLGKLELAEFNDVIKANGRLDVPPDHKASVSSYFGGTVKEIRLITGDEIRKGQTLFVLENPEFVQMQQEYLEAKSQLVYLKSDFERQKQLASDKVSSQKKYLKAETDYEMNLIKLKSLRQKLLLMDINPDLLDINSIRTSISIKSPIAGFVSGIHINKGVFVGPSQAAVDVINTDLLHLELNIYEKDLMYVKVKQPIHFKIQGQPARDFEAVVERINKSVDSENRTIRIHGELSDKKSNVTFTPGMYVSAEIYATAASKLCLPQDAVVEMNGKYYVLLSEGGTNEGYRFVKREVKIGTTQNGLTEILNSSYFEQEATFIVKGSFNLITE